MIATWRTKEVTLREQIERWMSSHGHGAITKLARESGVNRTTVTTFLAGKRIGKDSAAKLQAYIDRQYALSPEQKDLEHVFGMLASSLEQCATCLRDLRIPAAIRLQSFRTVINSNIETLPLIERHVKDLSDE